MNEPETVNKSKSRKFIQITAAPFGSNTYLFALANDGTLWSLNLRDADRRQESLSWRETELPKDV